MHMTAKQAANLITNAQEQHNCHINQQFNITYKIQPALESTADLDIIIAHRLLIHYFTTHHHSSQNPVRQLASLLLA
jgi:hypothetical protein